MRIFETNAINFSTVAVMDWNILGWGFSRVSDGNESVCSAGDWGLIPGLGRSPGEEKGYPLPYSCLENSMDRRAWWATSMGSQRRASQMVLVVKNPHVNCRRCKRLRFNFWVGKIPWRRKWHSTPFSGLGNPIERGTWWAIVRGVTKSWTQLSTSITSSYSWLRGAPLLRGCL